jgi:hypothetical protein
VGVQDEIRTLADLRRGAEQKGSMRGTISNLLPLVGVSDLARDHERVAQALVAHGLVSDPPISPALRKDTIVTLSVSSSSVVASSATLDIARPAVLRRFDTDNHFLQRLFAHELFGVVPDRSGELFRKLETVGPEEMLISGLTVRHGLAQGGVLLVTTHWLRYIKRGVVFTAIPDDDFWPLDGSLELHQPPGDSPLFRTPDGNQFQIFPAIPIVSRKQTKSFFGIYKLAALAIHHFGQEKEEAALEGMAASRSSTSTSTTTRSARTASPRPSGGVADLKDLVAMRDAGDLTPAEFDAAKARLLGM